MTAQLRLIELSPRQAEQRNRKLDLATRNLGRRGVAAARVALANARQLPEVDLDAA